MVSHSSSKRFRDLPWLLILVLLAVGASGYLFFLWQEPPDQRDTGLIWRPVSDVLYRFGEPRPPWALQEPPSEEAIALGRSLIHTGLAPDAPKGTPRQSKYFTCTDCHNISREDPDLTQDNPATRLPYVAARGQALLQGETFWGMYNKTRWYNGYWMTHYGKIVTTAQHDLRAAVQVCAEHCSQGRIFTEAELNGVMAWLWERQMRLGDLGLDEEQLDDMAQALVTGKPNAHQLSVLKSYYLPVTAETKGAAPPDLQAGYGLAGKAKTGQQVFQASCLHCHNGAKGSAAPSFQDRGFTAQLLMGNIGDPNPGNFYTVLRNGTEQHGPYMPPFMTERMSNQQIADLRAYLEELAGMRDTSPVTASTPQKTESATSPLDKQVVAIFQNNCAMCHDSLAKEGKTPANGIGFLTDLPKLARSPLVQPHPATSTLARVIASGMMPLSLWKSIEGPGPLSATDKATIQAWLATQK